MFHYIHRLVSNYVYVLFGAEEVVHSVFVRAVAVNNTDQSEPKQWLCHCSPIPFSSRSHWICSATESDKRMNETSSNQLMQYRQQWTRSKWTALHGHKTDFLLLYMVVLSPTVPARPPPSHPNSQSSVCHNHSPAPAGDTVMGGSTPLPALKTMSTKTSNIILLESLLTQEYLLTFFSFSYFHWRMTCPSVVMKFHNNNNKDFVIYHFESRLKFCLCCTKFWTL